MKLAIHQPEFMPWPGFFNKMALADEFVILDNVQFKKRYYENRNKIVSPAGQITFLCVPVKTKGRFGQPIREVEIDNSQTWKAKLLKTIYHYYCNSPYFSMYFHSLSEVVERKEEYKTLLNLNLEIINFFRKHLGISTPIVFSSKINIASFKASDLILQICLQKKAAVYLCGSSGREYLKVEDFHSNGIEIEWLDYKAPVYKQLCPTFISNLSTLDILFNNGESSFQILKN